ncbi:MULTISPECIES: flagellar biosynthetic protein FliQ [Paraburkholderia]|uniref:Flagellar biosynthetic protein FliQ n=1 Tax=Paraburkholderia acidicola TaxID=1912599 RepID=A0ABV1LTR8_9BURK|nr:MULTISPECIES: flagellar biosynthetic protein FliQ [Paraburkholderia]MCX4161455.1 flagellar biosynthetic protein FliQ [Paraburkholderia megapolitana]MDN7156951.1 flagellar biosynthetic protein FliQ [Paraburkholderia sp. CHISQ3]MDQ6493996.1 flagellar biosynthetic protein FliQ [Paraburkholderia megapolitana]
MADAAILDITREALLLVLMLSLPVVAVATIAAVTVAIVQAVTQVQDSSIGLSVRMIVVMVTVIVLSGWGARQLMVFGRQALERVFGIAPGLF